MNEDLDIQLLLDNFCRYLAAEERSRATIEKYKRDLEGFFRFIKSRSGSMEISKEGVLTYKEALKVKPLKIQRRVFCPQEEELTFAEYRSLLGEARVQGKTRLWLVMQTLCATGIRVSELCFITVEAARQHRAIVSSKGKSRLVFLPKELCKQLLKYSNEQKLQTGWGYWLRSPETKK